MTTAEVRKLRNGHGVTGYAIVKVYEDWDSDGSYYSGPINGFGCGRHYAKRYKTRAKAEAIAAKYNSQWLATAWEVVDD